MMVVVNRYDVILRVEAQMLDICPSLSCLAKYYAETTSVQTNDMNEFVINPWRV
jgi:hypothetical protein